MLLSVSRTSVDIDDALISEVMRRYRLPTKKGAVNLALRRLLGDPLTTERILALEGIGWECDLDEMRSGDGLQEF